MTNHATLSFRVINRSRVWNIVRCVRLVELSVSNNFSEEDIVERSSGVGAHEYVISYSYAANFSRQRNKLDVESFTEFIQTSGLWSVISSNLLLYRYDLQYLTT